MSELLKKYYETEELYKTEEYVSRYKSVNEWSYALNCELGKILEKMNMDDLVFLMRETAGPYRMIIKKYIKDLEKHTKHKAKIQAVEESNSEMVATAATRVMHG